MKTFVALLLVWLAGWVVVAAADLEIKNYRFEWVVAEKGRIKFVIFKNQTKTVVSIRISQGGSGEGGSGDGVTTFRPETIASASEAINKALAAYEKAEADGVGSVNDTLKGGFKYRIDRGGNGEYSITVESPQIKVQGHPDAEGRSEFSLYVKPHELEYILKELPKMVDAVKLVNERVRPNENLDPKAPRPPQAKKATP